MQYESTCSSLHRGLCQHADSSYYHTALAEGKALDNHILDSGEVEEGDWIEVALQDTATASERIVYVAHKRWRDPKLSLLTLVRPIRSGEYLSIDVRNSPMTHMCAMLRINMLYRIKSFEHLFLRCFPNDAPEGLVGGRSLEILSKQDSHNTY